MKLIAIAVAILLAGCLSPTSRSCPGGTVCPRDQRCAIDSAGLPACVDQQQIDQCSPDSGRLADGTMCMFGASVGACANGACFATACGNGIVDPGEVCDDGGQPGTCRADCKKIEVCGDTVIDSHETCDDGNTNAADGCDACVATTWVPTAVTSAAVSPTDLVVASPGPLAYDRDGLLYFSSRGLGTVSRLDRAGVPTRIAGGGLGPNDREGVPATQIALPPITAIAVDGLGNVYLGANGGRAWVVDPVGTIHILAGTGVSGLSGDGGFARQAKISQISGIAVDGLGDVFLADVQNDRIRKIDPAGIITTFAGGTGNTNVDGPGLQAAIPQPTALAFHAGALYVGVGSGRILAVDADTAVVSKFAGSGVTVGGNCDAFGLATNANLAPPVAIAFDGAGGVLFILEPGSESCVERVAPDGTIHEVAGGPHGTPDGPPGDGGPALAASFDNLDGLACDGTTVAVADAHFHRIRAFTVGGTIDTVLGTGSNAVGLVGLGARSTPSTAEHLAVDSSGRLYFSDPGRRQIYRVEATGVFALVAGTGGTGNDGDGGAATSAAIGQAQAIAIDGADNLYIVDTDHDRIRKVAPSGTISTVAGTGGATIDGDGGPATSAALPGIDALAADASGNLYVGEIDRVRRIDAATGTITAFAGGGGALGDGGPATAAKLGDVIAIGVDAGGTVYLLDDVTERVRAIAPGGTISTVAGTGTAGSSGDGGPATAAPIDADGMAVAGDGTIYLAEADEQVLRVVRGGTISHLAGTGDDDSRGDGGPASDASVSRPGALATFHGDVFAEDTDNFSRVRRIAADGTITTVIGDVDAPELGTLATARLPDPRAIVVAPSFTLIAGGVSASVLAIRAGEDVVRAVAGRYLDGGRMYPGLARYQGAAFPEVGGIAYDAAAGRLYVSEPSVDAIAVITVVDPADETTWTIAPFAGAATAGFADGAAAAARFRGPTDLALDAARGVMYVADTGNHVVRAIDLATKVVTTVAGSPETRGFAGDGGAALAALLNAPQGLAVAPASGDLFIADTANDRVRRVTAPGTAAATISTVAGVGFPSSAADGAPAFAYPVAAPRGLAFDAIGNLYVASSSTVRQVAADAHGVVDGDGAMSTIYGTVAQASTYPADATHCLTGLAVVDATTLEVADECAGILVKLVRGPK